MLPAGLGALESQLVNNAILYARFSPKPEEGDLELQIERMEAYCALAELNPVMVLQEPDVSARKVALAERKKGKELLKLLAEGKAQHVVVQKLDRIFRCASDGLIWTSNWSEQGISLHLADQGGNSINAGTAVGNLIITFLLGVSEFEAAHTAERTALAIQSHQHNGRRMSKEPPFGWTVDPHDPKALVEAPAEQAILEEIHEFHRSGMSARKIAGLLTDRHTLCRGRKHWHHNTIARILKRTGNE